MLRVKVDESAAAKKYLLDVELRGIDEKNNVVIFRRTVPVTVNEIPRNLPSMGILGAVISVIAAAGFYLRMNNARIQ